MAFTLLTTFLVGTLGISAPIPKEVPKNTAEKLLGTWKLTKGGNGDLEEITFLVIFEKDGKMTLNIEPKGSEKIILKGTYKVDGEKIDYTMEQPEGGKKKEILVIKKLTEEELITEDPEGIKEEFKRVKEKKKDK